jgi:hypothetical protein
MGVCVWKDIWSCFYLVFDMPGNGSYRDDHLASPLTLLSTNLRPFS